VRIILLDLKKYGILASVFRVLLVFLLIFGIISLAANGYYLSEEYAMAMIEQSEKKIVVIDAGHGGEDSGAVGISGIYEKDLNLYIAKELGELFINE
jgi:N-acetylmuramoyl-L-alanine amidase